MLLSWLCSLVCLATAPGTGGAQAPDLAGLRARDARVSFTTESARRARTALEGTTGGTPGEVAERAVIFVTLGAGGSAGDLARLEAGLASDELQERRGALFALGELGSTGWPDLERALAADTSGLEEELCVALARAAKRGSSAADERLRTLAGGDDALARAAVLALAWSAGEPADALGETLTLYYELRWSAARTFGLVDGLRGPAARVAERLEDEEFLDRVVLSAATILPAGGLRAHLTEILCASERPAALRVAALVMPDELERACRTGEWQPSSEAWGVVLATLEAQRGERKAKKLLAFFFPDAGALAPLAGRLLWRAGGDMPWSWVEDEFEKGDAATRTALIEATGDRGEKERVPDLEVVLERRPELAAVTSLALARLGNAPAKKDLETLLQGPASPAREAALAALARVLHDKNLWRQAELAVKRDDTPAELRLELQLGLARNGATVDHAPLRAELEHATDPARRLACVRALARAPEPADVEAMAALFPVCDDLELDVELALVLLAQRHPETGALVTTALWGKDWNRSVLAAGLVVAKTGPRGLLDEIDSAPRTATERQLRRAGFALGEWAGIEVVETLERTRSESDPVLQGALLGSLAGRAEGGEIATPSPRVDLAFPAAPAGEKAGKTGKAGKGDAGFGFSAPKGGGKKGGKKGGKHRGF